MSEDVSFVLNQLTAARNEIKNLRQQIVSLKHLHKKDVDELKNLLTGSNGSTDHAALPSTSSNNAMSPDGEVKTDGDLPFKIIGHVETCFTQKRGLPRQPGILSQSQGIVHIYNTVLTNPEHALEGLEQFSHMWILFYFHINNNTHVRAKVAPPRLDGARTGVFATRSPHRPSPIGLSLVKIDSVENNCIFFSGVDMVDGTPVLDVKPYIPQYDMPYPSQFNSFQSNNLQSLGGDHSVINGRNLQWERLPRESDGRSEDGDSILQDQSDVDIDFQDRLLVGEASQSSVNQSDESTEMIQSQNDLPSARILDGRDSDEVFLNDSQNIGNNQNDAFYSGIPMQSSSQREAPEGSEGSSPPSPAQRPGDVRVPDWIVNPVVPRLTVEFSDHCVRELLRISETLERQTRLRTAIARVLAEDPRSVYLRTRHPDEDFTCTIEGVTVTCVFNDESRTCLVIDATKPSTAFG